MVRTRIAPSPTGEDLHIGNLHVALINWVFAKRHEGQFIVRIEDTDRERYVKGSEERILKTVKDYGLLYDEGPDVGGASGPYRQSERLEIYQSYAKELIDKEAAYYCFCTKERLQKLRERQLKEKKVPRYDKYCLNNIKNPKAKVENDERYVIRLKVPSKKEIVFTDIIRGEIKFLSDNVDDQILIKSDGYPTYHLAVVVDDHLMNITHVIRGEDWIPSTPKHILLYEAFGWDKPQFAHTPLLRNIDKSKMSKRKDPAWASWYLTQGYLPRAVLNYLALMGWSHPKQKEFFEIEEFIKIFDLKDMQAVGPIFDINKLEWLNGEHIRDLDPQDLTQKIINFIGESYDQEIVKKTVPLIKERIKKLNDYIPLCEFFFQQPQKYQVDLKIHKKLLQKIFNTLNHIQEWNGGAVGASMKKLVEEEKMETGEFFMVLRVAITGKKISPPLNESMEILGKKESLSRIKKLL